VIAHLVDLQIRNRKYQETHRKTQWAGELVPWEPAERLSLYISDIRSKSRKDSQNEADDHENPIESTGAERRNRTKQIDRGMARKHQRNRAPQSKIQRNRRQAERGGESKTHLCGCGCGAKPPGRRRSRWRWCVGVVVIFLSVRSQLLD
jgi:hypothetical protein